MLAAIRSRIFSLGSSVSKHVNIEMYITVILPVLYGCETWLLTLREQKRLRC